MDISSGEVFANTSPGNAVTAARLNNAVNGATILPAFLSGKASTAPILADKVLSLHSGVLTGPTITQILALQAVDSAADVGSMRTLGTSTLQACGGDDDRLRPAYVITFPITNNFSPLDATTYYLGGVSNAVTADRTSWAAQASPIPHAGRIKVILIHFSQSTVGSNQAVTFNLKVDDATNGGTNPDVADVLLGNAVDLSTGANKVISFINLTQLVQYGDYIAIKMICPTWTTNPVINGMVTIYFETAIV